MDSNRNITKHGLQSSSGNYDFSIGALDLVGKLGECTKLVLFIGVVPRYL